ncbi:MAG TPA: hypothetical protein VHD34_06505 [Xanthobacteraceae bacterium]|nr:hypothetical protein [Xanthobacteraceae bacterium]
MTRADSSLARALFLAALIGAIFNFIAFYPGILHHDAWAYFDAARKFDFTNWQPPLLGYLWIPLQKIYDGPQPMFVLFIAGYWIGFFLLARAYAAEDRAIGAWVLAAAFFPLALNYNGVLVKDISMSLCLLLAAGIAIGMEFGTLRKRAGLLAAAWIFLIAAGFMRANALFGLPPLIDLLAAASSTRWAAADWKRRAAAVLVLGALFVPGHMLADRYVWRVTNMHPISPLQIFDLGGITHFSGEDAFKGFFGPNFVERNKTCYSPRYWDVYGWLRCPEVYENLKPQFGAGLTRLWIEGIAAHPLAYLEHRLAHFNRFVQFFCGRDCEESVETGVQSTNQKEFTFSRGPFYRAIDFLSEAYNHSPLGRPYVWILICLAWSAAAFGIPNPATRRVTQMLALSGAMYGLAYVVIGIASDYRYIDWTMLCALITTPAIVARVLLRRDTPARYRWAPLGALIGITVLREIAVRLLL